MSRSDSSILRTTQRAPRSCLSCASRKVKCDKAIPCSTCISRGTAASCVRETVIVRGEIKIANDPPDLPTYGDLLRENEQLRHELDQLREASKSVSSQEVTPHPRLEAHEEFETMLFDQVASVTPRGTTKRVDWATVIVPSRSCSDQLVAYDRQWNSWAHYALEYPQFEAEHDEFLRTIEEGASLESLDRGWLALYFSVLCAALLMMDEDEARKLSLPDNVDIDHISRNWYEAALFCLHEADFMRRASVRSVQAIAVLGMCFNNFGDPDVCVHLWSCALRIAQKIGLDNPDSGKVAPLTPQGQRRLWWTLVICEWLAVPYHRPQIEERDMDMTLPELDAVMLPSEYDNVQPTHYHIFMARTSIVYYRFRVNLRAGLVPLDEVVRRADGELAEVIDTLPEYLQPESDEHEAIHELEVAYPWVKWQRFDITLVLLHHRLRINRVLQREWLSCPGKYEWARAVCIKSAKDIIWISHNWDQPATMRKQWALSLHIFVAAILLLREWESADEGTQLEYSDNVETAIAQLDEVKQQNALAFQAAAIIRHFRDDRSILQRF